MAKNSVTVLSYAQRLEQSAPEKQSAERQFNVVKAQSQFQVSIAETTRDLAIANQNLERARGAEEFNLGRLVDAARKVEDLERGLEFLNKEYALAFPA